MRKEISLNGAWTLYYYDPAVCGLQIERPEDVERAYENGAVPRIPAVVPGNAELDLARAGVIEGDLFRGMATRENQKWESYDWWYIREFDCPKPLHEKDSVTLTFGGVDCFAEYFVNGVFVYESRDAYMDHSFEIADLLEKKNTLAVHIRSTMREASLYEFSQTATGSRFSAAAHVRKPVHSFGWDILPRCISAGLTRDVKLTVNDGLSFMSVSYHTLDVSKDSARLVFTAQNSLDYETLQRDVCFRVSGRCKGSRFEETFTFDHQQAIERELTLEKPMLWWPEGYGDANVYDTKIELLIDGKVCDRTCLVIGIRSVVLKRTDTLLEKDHDFRFIINGVPVMLTGSNWVPLSPYHSMDRERYKDVLPYWTDTHSNIVRVWGGGVYEQEEFYDYCDRHGICVWQDFMAACMPVDQDPETMALLREEFSWAVKTLRNHPSIILWAGDNEIDESLAFTGRDGNTNRITRKLLPEILAAEDPFRPFLPSSPYLPEGTHEAYKEQQDIFVERHLWGARDYFKADFYRNSKAHFVSECGYQGCPSVESLREMYTEQAVWPIFNQEWILHSADQHDNPYRVELTWNQVRQLFGFEPESIEDFSLASQISQSEAKKFFIERIRLHKPYTSGIIWWNMMDGWPQLSDAVVDFYHRKKLAYDTIKRSQEPVCLMFDELANWQYTLYACNDTLQEVKGTYKVYDIDEPETILDSGSFELEKNETRPVGKAKLFYSDKKFLVIEWKIGKKVYRNHYLAGMVPFDFEQYKGWLRKFAALEDR